MRRAHDQAWLKDKEGRLVALNLGADFTAEHEFGIKEIKQAFGISDDPALFGIKRRQITQIPGKVKGYYDRPEADRLVFKEFGTKKEPHALLILEKYGAETHANALAEEKKDYRSELTLYKPMKRDKPSKWSKPADDPYYTLATAWDEGSFGIHVIGLGQVNQLKELYKAIQEKDLAIWLGGGGVFQNAGLCLGIVSRVPADQAETMRAADEDRFHLLEATKKIGLAEELTKKGLRWFALSPKWAKEKFQGTAETAYEVVYFLNPMEQHQNNSGWFTVEQLREWADGKGPIPKKVTSK